MQSERLAITIRRSLEGVGIIREVKMFGGIGFMLNGNMVASASKRGLLARTGEEQQSIALKIEGAKPMVMRGRVLRDYIYLKPPHLSLPAARRCLKLAIAFVLSLLPNPARGRGMQTRECARFIHRLSQRRRMGKTDPHGRQNQLAGVGGRGSPKSRPSNRLFLQRAHRPQRHGRLEQRQVQHLERSSRILAARRAIDRGLQLSGNLGTTAASLSNVGKRCLHFKSFGRMAAAPSRRRHPAWCGSLSNILKGRVA
jgi:TfoX/Sxy family transcriptional regulator of competence genes